MPGDRYLHRVVATVEHTFYTDAPLLDDVVDEISMWMEDSPGDPGVILDALPEEAGFDHDFGVLTYVDTKIETEQVRKASGGTLLEVLGSDE